MWVHFKHIEEVLELIKSAGKTLKLKNISIIKLVE